MSYLELAKKAERKLRRGRTWISESLPPSDRTVELEADHPRSECPTPEVLTALVLSEFRPDEVVKIIAAWHNIFGIQLDPEKVRRHLEGLRKWQSEWMGR